MVMSLRVHEFHSLYVDTVRYHFDILLVIRLVSAEKNTLNFCSKVFFCERIRTDGENLRHS